MVAAITCPSCGSVEFDLRDYESMMVLSPQEALFTILCHSCGTPASAVCRIPDSLRQEVLRSADELGAGMGRDKR